MSLLEVQDLNVWYGLPSGEEIHAVRGVSFCLAEGERLGLVGESGSGKTTAILALMGLLPGEAWLSGRVTLAGAAILEQGEAAVRQYRWRDIAMIFQGAMNALNPVKKVGWQIAEPMLAHGVATGHAARQRTGDLLERVGLPAAAAAQYPHQLSGGMRQRVAIAMALACGPKVLLADEPTTALDVMVQAQILDLLDKLSRDLGLALVLVTHDLPVVSQLCGRAAVMYAGEIVEGGSVDDLFHHPRHPYTRLLFQATPDLSPRATAVSIAGTPPRLDQVIHGCPFEPRCGSAFARCQVEAPVLVHFDNAHDAACHLNSRFSVPPVPAVVEAPAPELVARPHVRPKHAESLGAFRAASTEGPQTRVLNVRDLGIDYPIHRSIIDGIARRAKLTVHAVQGLSLHLQAGEMLALIGESGCGKTTTAQAILRMVEPRTGCITLGETDVTHMPERRLRPMRHRVQMIYQDPYDTLDPRYRVRDIIAETMIANRTGGDRISRRTTVREALERVELSPAELYMDRYPHELSGGQRQRVAIAGALVLEPELLLADEPVSMLDVSVRAGILSLLNRLSRETRMAVVMITHDLSTAAHFADRIAVMYLGRIVEEGPARAIIDDPRHPYTQALLSVVPRRDPRDRLRPNILRGEAPNPVHVPSGCAFHPRCPLAEQQCSENNPALRVPADLVVGEGHRVACLLA